MSNRRGSILDGWSTRQSRRNQLSWVRAASSYPPSRQNVTVAVSLVWVWKKLRVRASLAAASRGAPIAVRSASAAPTRARCRNGSGTAADQRKRLRPDSMLRPRDVPTSGTPVRLALALWETAYEVKPWRKWCERLRLGARERAKRHEGGDRVQEL